MTRSPSSLVASSHVATLRLAKLMALGMLPTLVSVVFPAGAGAQRVRAGHSVVARAAAATAPVDSSLYRALVWRNVGPFRGGRIAATTGVIGQPGVFYVGMPAGGV